MSDEKQIDLRALFNELNKRFDDRLICKKLYIVPAMKYWADPENCGFAAMYELGDKPFTIEKMLFNPDESKDEIKGSMKDFMARAMVIGEDWDKYQKYRK